MDNASTMRNIQVLITIGILWIQSAEFHSSSTDTAVANHTFKTMLRVRRQVEEDPCQTFLEDNPVNSMEFYSPGWPHNYPANMDCLRILEAPRGFIITLNFLYTFRLEDSADCESDYIEVRNGEFRYSKLEGRFCGSVFPKEITSSGRYLWLRFRSDDTVEDQGFKIVYNLVPRSDLLPPEPEHCIIERDGIEGIFSDEDIPKERMSLLKDLDIPIDCTWNITVTEGWKVLLTFLSFKLKKPNECSKNFIHVTSVEPRLKMIDDAEAKKKSEKNYCGSTTETVTSINSTMYVRLYLDKEAISSKFKALFTAFKDKKSGENCANDEFDCEDATCISKTLRCNGNRNCLFTWDEEDCPSGERKFSMNIIIIMVVFSLIIIGMCITFVYTCTRKLVRDHKTIQENIRQSREQQLNVLGQKNSTSVLAVETVVSSNPVYLSRTRSRSPSSPSNSSQGLIGVPNYDRDNNDEDDHRDHGDHVYGPTMVDNACQTRESLFDPYNRITSPAPVSYIGAVPTVKSVKSQTRSPPPVPAPRLHYGFMHPTGSPPPPAPVPLPGPPPPPPETNDRYRAEAKIKVERIKETPESGRSYSVITTKSAPDIIVTH